MIHKRFPLQGPLRHPSRARGRLRARGIVNFDNFRRLEMPMHEAQLRRKGDC
jgi:hypothetical protein